MYWLVNLITSNGLLSDQPIYSYTWFSGNEVFQGTVAKLNIDKIIFWSPELQHPKLVIAPKEKITRRTTVAKGCKSNKANIIFKKFGRILQ